MPCTESRAMRALLTTNETSLAIRGSLPYQVMLNVDGINIYIMTYVTIDDDQIGLPVFRIGLSFSTQSSGPRPGKTKVFFVCIWRLTSSDCA